MPREGDLSKCKIYKIVSMNNPDMVYYGSTCQTLSQRFATHKSVHNTSSSKLIIEKGDAIILLIEEYPCNSVMEAKSREAYYILNNQCVNKNIPGRTSKEYRDAHKEQAQIYRDSQDKEERQKYNKNYYETNKDKILEKLTTKVTCKFCNREVSYNNLNKHYTLPICERTQEKNKYLASRQNI
jgi:hypothetical protein